VTGLEKTVALGSNEASVESAITSTEACAWRPRAS
jgi:hypothetical protein